MVYVNNQICLKTSFFIPFFLKFNRIFDQSIKELVTDKLIPIFKK